MYIYIAIRESVDQAIHYAIEYTKPFRSGGKTTPHKWCPARKEPTNVCYIPPCVGLSWEACESNQAGAHTGECACKVCKSMSIAQMP